MSPTFRTWLRRYNPGFYTHSSWSWRIAGTLVTHWPRTNIIKIYHQHGRHTEWHPADTERARTAVQSLLLRRPTGPPITDSPP